VPLLNVHSRLRPCPAVEKRAIFGFGVCTDAAALQLPFEEHACRSLEQVGDCVFVLFYLRVQYDYVVRVGTMIFF
jgi:hypothetical protein